jgi:uncharacterized protein YkwD
MKKIALIALLLALPLSTHASLASDQQGKILLQVEENGEAWYVYPKDFKRYFLGRPEDAYEIMRFLGLGITDADLARVQAGETEILNSVKGYILLQVEQHGEAYYVHPENGSVTYMQDGTAAFDIMREFGLGIANEHLAQIAINDTNDTSSEYAHVEQRTHEVINDHRESINADELEWSDIIADIARVHSEDMATGVLEPSHDGFDQRIASISAQIPEYNGGAENLAWNYSSDPGLQALNWWLTSEGHKASLENDFYNVTGIGVAKSDEGKYFITQLFINTD